ncbi:MAG: hypothetical protein ACE15F_17945 [bacterium]
MNPVSHDSNPCAIESRLARLESLERKYRHLRRLGLFTFFCSCAVLAIGLCEMSGISILPRKAVYAQSFIVQDARGVIRAQLGADSDKTVLALYDKSGFHRAALTVLGDESAVHVYDGRGIRRGVFGLTQVGPCLVFMNPNGLEQSGLMTREDGATELVLRDIQRRPVESGDTSAKRAEAFRFDAVRIWNWLRFCGLGTIFPNKPAGFRGWANPRFDEVR